MDKVLLVFVGGGLGAVARYGVGIGLGHLNLTSYSISLPHIGRLSLPSWPYATFSVNLLGGLLMGILVGALAQRGGESAESWRLALGVGLLGGFTTFSAFSLETALLIERRDLLAAGSYVVLSVTLCVLAVFAGLILTRRVLA